MKHFSHQTSGPAGPKAAALGARHCAALFTGYALALLIVSGSAAEAQNARAKAGPSRASAPKAAAAAPTKMTAPPVAKTADKPVTVMVRPNCEVAGPVFTLGEIA